ncbi:UNVERIFIED_CONTAM: hypothetical protein FKN15_045381, partial [Acipenser sinensis]
FTGARVQPRVQFQRRALSLPQNSTYSNLTAFLTAACSPWEVDSFPYLQGLEGNRTGNSSRFELTPVTAVSIHLLGNDGTEILVSGPIYVTVPLPANSNLKENDHIPAWSFDQKLGAWLKSSLGFVQKEGNQLTLTYIAPHLGYWVAAMSPLNTEKTLMELRGGKPLPHPRAWFVSLDGRSNAHIRHSYIDLQRAGKNGSNDASLDSGVDMNEPKSARKNRIGARERKIQKVMAYTQLVYVDDVEQNGSEHESAIYNPEDNALGPVLDGTPRPKDNMVSPEQQQDIVTRTVEAEPQPEAELPTSPEHDTPCNDDGGEDENKKSPWQKREERPLMSFNLK